jgi:hypothetical protein
MSAADPGSKMSPAKEQGDVADVGEDPCGTGRADARDVRGSLRTGATKVYGPESQPTASPGLLRRDASRANQRLRSHSVIDTLQ